MLFFTGCLTSYANAFPCYITIVKEDCWLSYNVTVDVFDSESGKVISSVIIPEGESWARQNCSCRANETLAFQARFTPVFWKGDEDKVYSAQHYWQLPKALVEGEKAWNLTLCFPTRFAYVPLPPEAKSNCSCNMKGVTPISPQ